MRNVSDKLSLHQISRDLARLRESHEQHMREDETFQKLTVERDDNIQRSLSTIMERLDPDHESYILRNVEEKVETMSEEIRPLIAIYKGAIFGRQALTTTAGVVGALTVIGSAAFWMIRLFKP